MVNQAGKHSKKYRTHVHFKSGAVLSHIPEKKHWKPAALLGVCAVLASCSSEFSGRYAPGLILSSTATPSPTAVPVRADVKVFLEGPYAAGSMSAALNAAGYLPTSQPYSGVPWNHAGGESVAAGFFAANPTIVDWILVDLRTGTASGTRVARRAGLLKTNGTIVDYSDPTVKIGFPGVAAGSYYVVLHHRNHLAVMSNTTITVSTTPVQYDFTNDSRRAYPGNGGGLELTDLGGGVWGMFTGEFDFTAGAAETGNSIDGSDACTAQHLQTGYLRGDYNMNGTVNCNVGGDADNDLWDNNIVNGAQDYVP